MVTLPVHISKICATISEKMLETHYRSHLVSSVAPHVKHKPGCRKKARRERMLAGKISFAPSRYHSSTPCRYHHDHLSDSNILVGKIDFFIYSRGRYVPHKRSSCIPCRAHQCISILLGCNNLDQPGK